MRATRFRITVAAYCFTPAIFLQELWWGIKRAFREAEEQTDRLIERTCREYGVDE